MAEIQTYHYYQLLEPMQPFLGDSESRQLNLEAHQHTLSYCKENIR